MQATEILMSEHRVIERVIAALESAATKLEQGERVSPEFFLDAASFIKGFADGCHHKKEEGVLFKAMEAAGVPVAGGPVGMMLYEHEEGRKYTAQMRQAAAQLQQNPSASTEPLIGAALGYATLLRQHILKEDRILFPMANQFIPEEQHAQVMDGFEHVEHEETGEGVHEKYLALAEKLESEMGLR